MTRSTPSRLRRKKDAKGSSTGSPAVESAATPTVAPLGSGVAAADLSWQKPMRSRGKIGHKSVAEKLVIRGNRNPNTRGKPMPIPNYGAIERRAK